MLGLEPMRLVIRLRWFGLVARKDDIEWIKCCTTTGGIRS